MVPAGPTADLVVVHPKIILAFLIARLDGPPHSAQPDHLFIRCVCREATEIVFVFAGGSVPPQEEPYLRVIDLCISLLVSPCHPYPTNISDNGTMGSLLESHTRAPFQPRVLQKFLNLDGARIDRRHLLRITRTWKWPHQSCLRDFAKEEDVLGYAVQKPWV